MRLASFTLNQSDARFAPGVEQTLLDLPGVSDVLLGGEHDTCSVVYDDALVAPAALRAALKQAGYDCAPAEAAAPRSSSCCGGCS